MACNNLLFFRSIICKFNKTLTIITIKFVFLPDKSLEFLEKFAKGYSINFAKGMFNKIAAEHQGKKTPKELRKLKYRTVSIPITLTFDPLL